MTNTEIIQAIRNEIERLYNDKSYSEDRWDMGYDCACEDMMSFLLTLESEKPKKFEDELKDYLRRYYNCDYPKQLEENTCSPTIPHIVEVARHFAEWQKAQSDKELSEKIASAYQLGRKDEKEQMMKEANKALESCDKNTASYKDAFFAGVDWKEREMMKEAVEGMINNFPYPTIIELNKRIPTKEWYGQKVKIIIVKED